MALARKIVNTDYPTDSKRITEFLNTYKDESDELIYRNALDDIRVRKETNLVVSLDHLGSYNQELANHLVENTPRYLKLFYQAADELIGEINFDFSSSFGALAATRNSSWAESRDPTDNSKSPFPPELHRPYFIRFTSGKKFAFTNLRDVRAASIGKLVQFRGLVTRVTQVKPLIRVASYTCSHCSEETFQVINSKFVHAVDTMPISPVQSQTETRHSFTSNT